MRLILNTGHPMYIYWGSEATCLYNDAYSRSIGAERHPGSLGQPAREVWDEVWANVGPQIEQVMSGGAATWHENQLVPITRNGHREDVFWTYSYGPIDEETAPNGVGGVLVVVSETTRTVQAELRQSFLVELGDELQSQAEPQAILHAAIGMLGRHLRASRVGYGEVNEDGTIDLRGTYTDGLAPLIGTFPLKSFGSKNMERHRQGFTVVYDDLGAGSTRHRESRATTDISALVSVPMVRQGVLLGALFVSQREPRHWSADEIATIEAVAARIRDALERAKAEAALRESDARFRAALQVIGILWTNDADGRMSGEQSGWASLTGQSPEQYAGYGWAQAVHPDDARPTIDAWNQAVAERSMFVFEHRVRRRDGVYRRFAIRACPVLASDGAVREWVGVHIDITDQRAAERQLQELNIHLEQRVRERTRERDRIWQGSRDLLVVIGADGIFRAVSPAWTMILGHRPDEIVGKNFLDFVHPDDVEHTLSGLDAAMKMNLTNFQFRYVHKDGTPRWISWYTSAEDGVVYAYGRDVTAERQQTEALRRAEEQLRQSQKMEAVGQLTGGLAHDFNNLLTAIIGSLDLLETRLAQGRAAEVGRYVLAAHGAARRAASLTQRLLAFSRRQTLDPRPVNINRLVSGMDELIRRAVGPSIELEVIGAAGLWMSLVDPNQLENALLNLCINGRDAMPDGGRLTIETNNKWLDERAALEQDLPAGQYVSLCVTDTGTGMTPEVKARAFDPFFTTKPLGEGTGLGLSMIYGFARQSGGQIRVYSEVGHGTTMCLYLPRSTNEEVALEGPMEESRETDSAVGETVLVVDDEPIIRMLVTEVLETMGYASLEAGDGAAAIEILRSDARIDLLVTDVGLPGGMNGRQVADAGRILRPDLKVLFITGYAENAVVGNGHLDPGMSVLTKPFAMDVIAARIKGLIDGG